MGCIFLFRFDIPVGTKLLGKAMFQGCIALQDITFPVELKTSLQIPDDFIKDSNKVKLFGI
jgi:hypothetical protein